MSLKICMYIVANKDERILLVDEKEIITSTEHLSEVPIQEHIIVTGPARMDQMGTQILTTFFSFVVS